MREAILLAYLDNMIGQDSSALSYNPYFSKNVYLHWWSYNSYEVDMLTDEECRTGSEVNICGNI